MANAAKLSEAARTALVSVNSNRQGAKPTNITASAHKELRELGLLGLDAGLTRQGSIARQKLMTALLNAAF